MKFTAHAAPERFAKLAALLGCDTAGMTQEEAAQCSIDGMIGFLKGIGSYKKLSQFGVTADHVDRLAESATTIMKVVLNKNPIVPTLEQVKELYLESL
jgi:alcohol dehydrogenase class IV